MSDLSHTIYMCRMEGVCSGVGEPPEQAWSHLGPFGYILQKTSLPARQAFLERIIAHWNAAKLAKLPAALQDFFGRAMREHAAALDAAESLLQYGASVLQISLDEVCLCSARTHQTMKARYKLHSIPCLPPCMEEAQ